MGGLFGSLLYAIKTPKQNKKRRHAHFISKSRYIPPLSGFGVILPEELSTMAVELKKQESLLAQIHGEMSVGSVAKHREEQLWEVRFLYLKNIYLKMCR